MVKKNHLFESEYRWPIYSDSDIHEIREAVSDYDLSYNQNERFINEFENECRTYFGTPYALSLNSGTSALHLAFLALGISLGDEVLVPTYTFPATVMPLLHIGAKIVFIDCESTISPKISVVDLKRKISKNTKAIVLSHMDGIDSNIREVTKIAKENKCYLIEDCAQAMGVHVDGKLLGTWGDVGVFSFQQKKIVSAGEGGLLISPSESVYHKAILYSYLQKRSYNEVTDRELKKYSSTGLGFNLRMHPLIAKIAYTQLKNIEKNIASRRNCLIKLSSLLSKHDYFICPQYNEKDCSYYSFRILINPIYEHVNIDKYIANVNVCGVPIERSTSRPLHQEPVFNEKNAKQLFTIYQYLDVAFIKEGLVNSEIYSKRVMRVPAYYNLSSDGIELLAEILIAEFKKLL